MFFVFPYVGADLVAQGFSPADLVAQGFSPAGLVAQGFSPARAPWRQRRSSSSARSCRRMPSALSPVAAEMIRSTRPWSAANFFLSRVA